LVSDAELALVTPDQQQLFESQVQRLPAFVRNLLVQHQGACVPITVTLKDDNDQMRFVSPVSIKNTLYGKIIRAKESASEEQVAIKLSSWETFLQRKLAENFMREARMNQLIQPVPASIVGVREVGCDREHHWTVMEYVDGGDLFDRIVSEHGVSEAEAWLWMHQGAEAIRHLHSRRVAHCDISAENFMVTADGNLKLCDMGQARLYSVAEDESGELRELPFAVGTAFGTKLYCQPPEMLLKQSVYGTKLDVFSMGVTLYTMLQGCRPFQHGAWLHDAEYGRCAQGLASQIALNARMQCMANQARPDPRCHLDPHCTFCASSEAAEAHASCRISAGAAEVIARMLCLPELRASIDEVLALPWMQQLPAATAADAEDVPQENSSQEGQLAHPAASSNAADNSKADAFAHSGNLSADDSMQV
jgi:serine/threonine protein kinase